jgi:hypothetical protein
MFTPFLDVYILTGFLYYCLLLPLSGEQDDIGVYREPVILQCGLQLAMNCVKEGVKMVMMKFWVEQSSLFSRRLPGLAGYGTGNEHYATIPTLHTLFHLIAVFKERSYYSSCHHL